MADDFLSTRISPTRGAVDTSYSRLAHGLATGCFLLGVPLIGHLFLSHYGFNPTDEGFTLAMARRVLDGQVPHRDFLSVRPALSAYLWAPVVALSGDSVLLLSRTLAWGQWAAIAWSWTCLAEHVVFRRSFSISARFGLAALTLVLCLHTFPIMAWHTVDGLFLLSVGLWSATSSRPTMQALAWFLTGTAPLCKQSFVLAPLAVVLARDRRVLSWEMGFVVLPAVASLAYIGTQRAFHNAIEQLTAQRNIIALGYFTYALRLLDTLPAFLAGAGIGIVLKARHGRWCRLSGLVASRMTWAIPLSTIPALLWPETGSFVMFFFALGLVCATLLGRSIRLPLSPLERRARRFLVIALLTAWSVSLSVAQNHPALAMGLLANAVLAFLGAQAQHLSHDKSLWKSRTLLAAGLVVMSVFGALRWHRIYRDAPVPRLNHELTGVMRGAAGIRTNERTARMLADLRSATDTLPYGKMYAILPDCAAWWIATTHANPLPFDWDNEVELGKPAIRRRAVEATERLRGRLRIFVSKYETDSLAECLCPLRPRYPLTSQVRANWTKVDETSFFEVYE